MSDATKVMTPEQARLLVRAVRARHSEGHPEYGAMYCGLCADCWPCSAEDAAAAVESLAAQVEARDRRIEQSPGVKEAKLRELVENLEPVIAREEPGLRALERTEPGPLALWARVEQLEWAIVRTLYAGDIEPPNPAPPFWFREQLLRDAGLTMDRCRELMDLHRGEDRVARL